jgi:hypothetical protein
MGDCKICGVPVVGLVGWTLYLGLFLKVLHEQWLIQGGTMFELKLLIDLVVHYGVYLMALMSAYGAIWCPYVYYNLLNQKETHRIASAKLKTQDEIHFIIEKTKMHKLQLLNMNQQIAQLSKEIESERVGQSKLVSLMRGWMGVNRDKREELQRLEQDRTKKQQEL